MEFDEFIFVMLRRNKDYVSQGKERDNEITAGHFQFINRMVESRDMFAAGPLDGAGGLYFFNADKHTKETVQELLLSDDSIKDGVFIPDIHKWFIPKHVVSFTMKELYEIEKSKNSTEEIKTENKNED